MDFYNTFAKLYCLQQKNQELVRAYDDLLEYDQFLLL